MAVKLDVSHPRLLAPGEGETISDRAERNVVVKCDHELVDVTWTRYEPDERGPDPHVHRHHADAWYVLDGELTFGLGPGGEELRRAAGGAFVLVPAGVIHTFRNDGPATARFLNIHAPSMGFARSLRSRVHEDEPPFEFDSFPPPADGGRAVSDVVVRGPGEGDSIMSGAVVFKAQIGDGEGTFSLAEITLPPDYPGPVLHRHARTLDSFYVLEGTLTIRLGEGEEVEAGSGSYGAMPPGTVHSFANRTDGLVRALNLMAPGGFEQYLKELAAAAAPGEQPDPATMAEIASRYDFVPA
jgi:mannose-6-phosphate isomerase-like protein (cupin superfamily)